MADFRKMFFVLVALTVVLVGTASAQSNVQCLVSPQAQPVLRQEGATEPVADIIFNCSGTLGSGQTGSQTVTLLTTAPITSYVQSTSNGTVTDALLLVNDTGTPVAGILSSSGTQMTFSGFTLPSAGTPFTLRITNVRVNATSLANGAIVSGNVLTTFPLTNNSQITLGAVVTSLTVAVNTNNSNASYSLAQCQGQGNTTAAPMTFTGSANISIKEATNTAFKLQSVAGNTTPGGWYSGSNNTESMYIYSGAVLANGTSTTFATPNGQSTSATRFRVNVSNIPSGVTVALPVTITGGGLVMTTSETGAFSIASVSQSSGTTVNSTGPTMSVTYEVKSQSPTATDTYLVPVMLNYAFTPPSSPALGSILVSATYGPTTVESSTNIPRFADTSSLAAVYQVSACTSNLLFTFMTNAANFDTGYAILNTSADPYGTSPQSGTCTLNWYGTGPAAGTSTQTAPIAAGQYTATTLGSNPATQGFQGYMIAVCNFQYAHGYAFLTDGFQGNGRGLSHGYVANVIPSPTLNSGRKASPEAAATSGSGEGLSQ